MSTGSGMWSGASGGAPPYWMIMITDTTNVDDFKRALNDPRRGKSSPFDENMISVEKLQENPDTFIFLLKPADVINLNNLTDFNDRMEEMLRFA